MADVYGKAGSVLAQNLMSKGLVGGAKKTLTDVGKTFTLGNMADNIFAGDDIFSRMGKKAFGSGRDKKDSSKTVSKEIKNVNGTLQSILESSSVLPNMAKDVSIIAQNMQQLVELNKPDADDFFRQEDIEESQKEAGDTQPIQVKSEGGAESGGEKKGGLLGLVGQFGKGIADAFKKVFNFKNILKVFKKIFLPIAIIGSLFNGIKDGFERYRETGSMSDAIFAGLGGVLEFLTFGFFGEDTIKNIYDNLSSFFDPVSKSIQKIFGGIKNFFSGIFGSDVKAETGGAPKPPDLKPGKPEIPDILKKKNIDKIDESNLKETTTTTKTVSVSKDSPMTKAEKAFADDGGDAEFEAAVAARRASGETRRPGKTPTVVKDESYGHLPDKYLDFGNERERLLKEKGLDSQGNPISPKPVNKGTVNFKRAVANAKKSGRYDKVMSEDGYDEYNLDEDKDSRAQTIKEIKADEPGISDEDAKAEREEQIKDLERQKKLMEDMKRLESGESLESVRSTMPSAMTPSPSTKGSEINEKSADIAEGQRMESAADQGGVIDNSTTNNSKGSTQSKDRSTPDVVNKDLFLTLNLGNALPDSF